MKTPEREAASQAEDLKFIREILAGDEAAYRHLLAKYERRIFSICFRITCNESAAEEAAAEAFVRAFYALKRFDQSRPFLPWLIRIAVNRAISTAEKERAYRPLPESVLSEPDQTGTAEDAARHRELARAAQAAVASLPPKLRAVVTLRIFEDLSYEEIARTLRLSIGTVMSRLSRGRERIKAALEKFR